MANYSALVNAILKHTADYEATVPLLNDSCRSRFFFQTHPTNQVCLFFHGFTAAPHQFVPLGEAFYRAGYNVLIPRLPGHGHAGNWSRHNPPPLPDQAKIYQEAAVYWLSIAQELGQEIVLGGLSGGGTLAAWLAMEYPKVVDRTLLFAPYLSSSRKVVDLFVTLFDGYFEWVQAEAKPNSSSQVTGYSGFPLPAIRVFLTMGQEILANARSHPLPPTFIISSDCDEAVGNHDHQALFEHVHKFQPMTWKHRFNKALAIPHTMMTRAEGNQWENLLNVMAKAFVQSRLTWAEVEEIGYRMTQGKTFPAVVAELGWQHKVSPDMPAMMTMVDKRSIVESRTLRQGKLRGQRR